ncbi:trichohyalin-like [Labrus mixtus]|uniref:trichohyalin-like n=1 Tax=Labrus mixtus TaxID=508554 RepID=UPI0029BFCCA5|nr:trichohyalin-like [Labrus mixtus]
METKEIHSRMIHVSNRRSLHYQHGAFTDLVIYTVVFLALMNSCRAQSEVIVPSQPVVSLVGEDVILPCHLDPVMNAFDMTVEWARPDLNPRFVLLWRQGEELETKKHPSFSGRTSVFIDELEKGNISLKLSKVKVSDEGGYKCFMPALSKTSTVQLVVGSVSSPVVQMIKNNNGVLLECESADWYPEPEMFWLDGEGNLLSAEPTETVRGPDGLYTVSSRVTVEKRHGRKFTCRVTQRKINQTREKHLTIPDHFFVVPTPSPPSTPVPPSPPSPPGTHVVIGAVIGCAALLFIPVIIFVVWRRRQKKSKNKKRRREDGSEHSEEEKLVTSKTDKTGFQVVNEKEENLPLISVKDENNPDKTGEKSETEDEGQRRETNYGDESEQETVKPVRDDSGHSIQIKHINTDQKMKRKETQQEAVSDEDKKETKTEKENREEPSNIGGSGSTGQKKKKENHREEIELKADRKSEPEPDQDETKYQPAESKEGVGVEIKQRQEERQEAGLQEDNDTTQRKSVEILNQIRGVEEEKQAEQQLDVKVKVREQREESKEGVMVEDNGRGEESLETDRKASVDETQRKADGKENQRREEAVRQEAQTTAKGITEEIKVEWTDGEKQESVTDKEADTDETQKKHKKITSESKGGEQQLMLQHSDMNKEMRERGVEGQEDLQQEEDMKTDQPQPNVIQSIEPLNTPFQYESATEGQNKEAFGRGQKEVQPQNINTDQKMEKEETQQEAVSDEDEKETKTEKENQEEPSNIGGSGSTGQKKKKENRREEFKLKTKGQSKEAFGRGQKEVQPQNINTDQKMEKEETQQEAASDEDEKETKTEKENREEPSNIGGSGSTGQKKKKENRREEFKLKADRERMKSKEKLNDSMKKRKPEDDMLNQRRGIQDQPLLEDRKQERIQTEPEDRGESNQEENQSTLTKTTEEKAGDIYKGADSNENQKKVMETQSKHRREREEKKKRAAERLKSTNKPAGGVKEQVKVEGRERRDEGSKTDEGAEIETRRKKENIQTGFREGGAEGQEELQEEEDGETDEPQHVTWRIKPQQTQEAYLQRLKRYQDEEEGDVRMESEEET